MAASDAESVEMEANMISEGLEVARASVIHSLPQIVKIPRASMALVMNQCEILRMYVDRGALRWVYWLLGDAFAAFFFLLIFFYC